MSENITEEFSEDISNPDVYGYGEIVDVVMREGVAVRIQIKDETKDSEFTTIDVKDPNLTEVLLEMKELGMPIAQLNAAVDCSFVGALPLYVHSVKELDHPKRLVGGFDSAFGGNFVVSGDNPKYNRIKERLEKSQDNGTLYWILFVVFSYQGQPIQIIIDVIKEFIEPKCTPGLPFDDDFDEVGFFPIDPGIVTEIFESFESTSSSSGPLTGIPFQYVLEGCEDRCHQMVKQILARVDNIQPIKLWAFPFGSKSLSAESTSAPPPFQCKTLWDFHTAPAVMTTRGVRIIDPSLSSSPESVTAWFASCLLYTSPSPRDQRGSRMPSSA